MTLKKLVLILLTLVSLPTWAQEDSTSTTIIKRKDTKVEVVKEKKEHSPKKAALFSAIVPGLGQAYNKKYWKMPIIYAGFGVLTYYIIDNTRNYRIYRDEFNNRTDGDSTTVPDPQFARFSDATIRAQKDTYSRWRDWSYFFTGLLYALNIMDAYVDAHLMDFNVSKDFLLTLDPHVVPVSANSLSLGLSLNLRLKNNLFISKKHENSTNWIR